MGYAPSMEFVAAKILGALAMPSRLILLALLLGVALRLVGARRTARVLVGLGVAGFAALAILPLGTLALRPLELHFPVRQEAAAPDGIVVLGGAIDAPASALQGRASVNAAAERLIAFAELGRRHPDATLIFTGGTGSVRHPDAREADWARRVVDGLGLPPERVIWDAEARTTRENATNVREIATPAPGETWLLISSAWHLPRAVASFQAAGLDVVPYPVDYRTTPELRFGFDPAAGLALADRAAHEWLGLLWYRINGWSDTLLPAR